jgi:hypothetical protein
MKNPSEIPKLQTARKRSCNHSAFKPKLQTARKHTGSGKRRVQIDIYEIEVDRAEEEDPQEVNSKLSFYFYIY